MIVTHANRQVSIGKAALIAGLAILLMALTVPFVEFYIFPKLIDFKNGEGTFLAISNNSRLFSGAIFIHFLTVVCDVTAAWALYNFLKPVHKDLSLLAAWFRLAYAAFNIAALMNLVKVVSMVNVSNGSDAGPNYNSVLFYLESFNLGWRFGLVFFGLYLILLGYLVVRSAYVPKIIGILLVIAGAGYLFDDLKYFFYSNFDTGFLWFTFFGELVFMFWLLIKGSRMKANLSLQE